MERVWYISVMEAAIWRCPTCGAPAASDAANCAYCKTRLLTAACPECLGLFFLGTKFCPHCGVSTEAVTASALAAGPCPECATPLEATRIGTQPLGRCGKCLDVWLDPASLTRICTNAEAQSAVLAIMPLAPTPQPFNTVVKYRKCPTCRELMNRKTFPAGRMW